MHVKQWFFGLDEQQTRRERCQSMRNPNNSAHTMRIHLIALVLLAFSAVASDAATLVHYQFTHAANDPTPLTPDVVGSNMTATNVTNTAGQQDSSSNVLRISDGTPIVAPAAYSSSNDFVAFRIDANSGYYFDLTSGSTPLIQFGIGRNSGAATLYSQMQIWGATSGAASASSTLLYTSAENSATNATTVLLSDTAGVAAINSINQYTSLYVQVQRRASASGTSVYRYDDFRIDGAVVLVPEPGTAIMCLGGLGMLAMRRRRHNGMR